MHIISKIKDVKERIQNLYPSFLITDLESLKIDLTKNKIDNEFIKYIPIAIVACYETFFKIIFAEFIDHGEPYLSNTNRLQHERKIEIDYKTIMALHGKKISLGDLFAFSLKYSSFDTIKTNFGIILGENKELITELKNITTFDLYDKSKQDDEILLIKSKIDEIVKNIYKIYSIRHIYSHEFNNFIKIQPEDAIGFIDSAIMFLKAIERLMWDTIYKGHPVTQYEMNQYYGELMNISETKLKEIENNLADILDQYNSEFQEIQNLWRTFRDKNSRLLADFGGKGGSIWLTLFASYMTQTTDKRIEELNWLLKQK
jgi:uncharacterized protein YecT (DUF1311 family)